ncbi:uracil-DNA glycosylase [Sphingomonas sp. PP-CC-3A-396]|uniref:uracil-DNA glycosylase n=1 Tax=Sphingomonas sp. PP-CC-3A-396 TaxID=2135655 RepID=UPI0010443E05|nr:uracil-DNA glycosylase [Sphingomonas sp. PP-CC-3A-396]TCQ09100.1 uracil-DNA glycosylase family 4 [Sphingomonas sp. PP-CC-3A-396]
MEFTPAPTAPIDAETEIDVTTVFVPVSALPETEPSHDCPLCPRLAGVREQLRTEFPGWWNAPVPAFGDPAAWLGIIGLAPGKHGANRTGRPFTGDYSGQVLFETLGRFGLANGVYGAKAGDGVTLDGAIILNAVKCLPPENKPTPEEIRTCRPFLETQADAVPSARVFVALGHITHQSAVKMLGGRLPKARFAHGAEHRMPDGRILIDSYHCSRYNMNTGVLTAEMFDAVFARALELRGEG